MSEQATSTATVQKPKSDQIEIGAIWKKEGKSQKFLAGNFDLKNLTDTQWAEFQKTKQIPVVIFTNKFKQNERHPDLRVYLSKPKDSTPAAATSTAEAPVADADKEII